MLARWRLRFAISCASPSRRVSSARPRAKTSSRASAGIAPRSDSKRPMRTRDAMLASEPMDFYRGRRVLVTGGLGFIGSTVARRLVHSGADVLIVDSMIPDYGGNPFNIHDIADRVSVSLTDIRDAAAM